MTPGQSVKDSAFAGNYFDPKGPLCAFCALLAIPIDLKAFVKAGKSL
jgi:hypothetical protein